MTWELWHNIIQAVSATAEFFFSVNSDGQITSACCPSADGTSVGKCMKIEPK